MSADNPYSPPEADIGDGRRTRPLRARPPQILQAIALLWISTALGSAASYSEAAGSWEAMATLLVIMVGMAIGLSVGIWRGRNWGRVLYLVLVVMSFGEFVSAWGIAERPALDVALEAVSFVADAGSFFLMFTAPGSAWFQPPEQGDRA